MTENSEVRGPNRYWTYAGLAIAHFTVLLAFLFLADLTQFLLHGPRGLHIGLFHFRQEFMVIGIVAFLFAALTGYLNRAISWKGWIWNSVGYVSLFIGAFLLVTYIMFIPQQEHAEFISIAEANKYVKYEDEVMVVEINEDARAYPHLWMRQPHIVGETIGGEEVVMTFCSLSHSGLAFSPYIDGEKLELKVFTQLQNNLIMYDTHTDQPIQQITGITEHSNKRLEQYPVQVMTYDTFREIYPNGKVFYNPPKDFRDAITRGMLMTVVNWQHEMHGPVFPTIDVDEEGINQLHPKVQVWGVEIDADQVAYTYDYFRANNWVINSRVGGKDIVLAYYPEHRTVGGFDRNVSGRTVTIESIEDIDVHGNTSHGRLVRIPVVSEVFWMIWYTFYPDTTLMHAARSPSRL